MRRLLIVGVILCLAAAVAEAAPTRRELTEARRRFGKANQLYDEGHYEEALRLYLAAYELVPSLDILFNIGLAREKVLDQEGCALSFRRYLDDASKNDPLRARAQEGFDRCRKRARIDVKISSIPSGAGILIGEESDKAVFRGRTPRDLELPPGQYRIAVELPGYAPLSQEVRVEIGTHPEVDFPLEKLSTLTIEADVAGASASLDDKKPAPLPMKRQLRAGTYEVRVFKDGYREVNRQVRIEAGEQSTLVLSLQPLPVRRRLRIEANARAQVVVAGKRAGTTPLSLEVSPGRHQVRVLAQGRVPFAGALTVPEHSDLAVKVMMAPERSRVERVVFWGLIGGAGVAAAVAGTFGVMALADRSEFRDRPSLMTADRGRRRARVADLLWASSLTLAASAALEYLGTSRESRVLSR